MNKAIYYICCLLAFLTLSGMSSCHSESRSIVVWNESDITIVAEASINYPNTNICIPSFAKVIEPNQQDALLLDTANEFPIDADSEYYVTIYDHRWCIYDDYGHLSMNQSLKYMEENGITPLKIYILNDSKMSLYGWKVVYPYDRPPKKFRENATD